MLTLRDHAGGDHSQFGEEGMIAHCLDALGIDPTFMVEFGAGDDPRLMNTWRWAEAGVRCVWAERDPQKRFDCPPSVRWWTGTVTSIDGLCVDTPDVLVVDVDGDDFPLVEAMTVRPPVLMVEHHPMIPPWVSYVGPEGCSTLALIRMLAPRGYHLAGVTGCNSLFTVEPLDLDTDLAHIFDPSGVVYAVSDVTTGDFHLDGMWPFGRGEELA